MNIRFITETEEGKIRVQDLQTEGTTEPLKVVDLREIKSKLLKQVSDIEPIEDWEPYSISIEQELLKAIGLEEKIMNELMIKQSTVQKIFEVLTDAAQKLTIDELIYLQSEGRLMVLPLQEEVEIAIIEKVTKDNRKVVEQAFNDVNVLFEKEEGNNV